MAVLDTQKRLALMIQDCYQDYEDEANRISMGATDGLSHYEDAEKYASIHQFNGDCWNDEPEIKALSVNCARRLRPINFVYRNASVESCPAVEMAWFQKTPLEAAKDAFGID